MAYYGDPCPSCHEAAWNHVTGYCAACHRSSNARRDPLAAVGTIPPEAAPPALPFNVAPGVRMTDRERDKHADVLREHYASGALPADEFERRMDWLMDPARLAADVPQMLADLPDLPAKAELARAVTRTVTVTRYRTPVSAYLVTVGLLWFPYILMMAVIGAGQGGAITHAEDIAAWTAIVGSLGTIVRMMSARPPRK